MSKSQFNPGTPIKVSTAAGLVYDEADKRCFTIVQTGQHGHLFAFVQCVDSNTDETRRYWGAWSDKMKEEALSLIMDWGGKWPALPADQEGA